MSGQRAVISGQWAVITGTLDEMIHDAVEAEKRRCSDILAKMKITAARSVEFPYLTALNKCQDAIRVPASEPETPADEPTPPADEPMTIDKIGDKLRRYGCIIPKVTQGQYFWCDFDADLASLIEAQARRDADFVRGKWPHPMARVECEHMADELLKAAGLE